MAMVLHAWIHARCRSGSGVRTEGAASTTNCPDASVPARRASRRPARQERACSVWIPRGLPLAEISGCDATDVDLAVSRAREAFDQGHWAKRAPSQRKEALIRLCKLITRNRRELAVMESLDSGKPILDCETIDIPETIETLKWHAELIDKIYDQMAPAQEDAVAMILREPIGVVAAILPWNFPLLMMAWKIGPALAAGNSVIVKPAEQTSLTALRLAELAAEAGLPRGVLQVLPGDGPTVGAPLGLHMDVDIVKKSQQYCWLFLFHSVSFYAPKSSVWSILICATKSST